MRLSRKTPFAILLGSYLLLLPIGGPHARTPGGDGRLGFTSRLQAYYRLQRQPGTLANQVDQRLGVAGYLDPEGGLCGITSAVNACQLVHAALGRPVPRDPVQAIASNISGTSRIWNTDLRKGTPEQFIAQELSLGLPRLPHGGFIPAVDVKTTYKIPELPSFRLTRASCISLQDIVGGPDREPAMVIIAATRAGEPGRHAMVPVFYEPRDRRLWILDPGRPESLRPCRISTHEPSGYPYVFPVMSLEGQPMCGSQQWCVDTVVTVSNMLAPRRSME